MKIREFLDASNVLDKMNLKGNAKFIYRLTKIIRKVKEESEILRETLRNIITPSEEFKNFERERMEILRKYAEFNERGEFKTDHKGNIIIDTEKQEEFKEVIAKFLEDNKDLLEERNKSNQKYEEFLNEEFELEKLNLEKIELDWIPEITIEQMRILEELNIIEE